MSDPKQVRSFVGDTFKYTHQNILNSKKKRKTFSKTFAFI